MTSKNLFSNFAPVLDAVKNKSWVIMVSAVAFFFSLPVFGTMSLQNNHGGYYVSANEFKNVMINTLGDLLGPDAAVTLMAMTVLGLIAGIAFFSYIHSKRKVDFFHSLPISRTKLFLVNYIAGAISVLLPFIVFYLVSLVIVGGYGDLQYIRKITIFQGLLVPILYFLAVYTVTVLAGVLTGNVILQGCAALYIMFIVPCGILIYYGLMDTFFLTNTGISGTLETIIAYSSPVINGFFGFLGSQEAPLGVGQFIALVCFWVIPLALGLFLYNKRPGEAATKSVAFPWFGPLVKYPLIVLGSLTMALIFYNAAPGESKAWLVFGLIVGALLVSRILEVIIAQDIKAVKKNWLNFVVTLVVTACITSVFVFDLTDYDEYIPGSGEVETVNIEVWGANMYGEGYYSRLSGEKEIDYNHRFLITDKDSIAAALDIAANGVENLGKAHDSDYAVAYSTGSYDEYQYQTAEAEAETEISPSEALGDPGETSAVTNATIQYTLKNGRTVSRCYDYIDKAATSEPIKTIISSEEFRRNQLVFLEEENLAVNSLTYLDTDFIANFTPENAQDFIEAYKTDANNLTLEDMTTKKVVATVSVYNYNVDDFSCDMTMPIYETYTNSLAVFANMGYSLEEYGTLRVEDVSEITEVSYYDDTYITTGQDDIKDPSEFSEIIASTHSENEVAYNYFLQDTGDGYYYVEGKLADNNYDFYVNRTSAFYWE